MAYVEWGVFNAEGCTANGMTEAEARHEAAEQIGDDATTYAAEVCPEHIEHERCTCEECATDEE